MKTGTHILSSDHRRNVMVKLLEDGSALLTVQIGLNAPQRVALQQSELGALKDVLS